MPSIVTTQRYVRPVLGITQVLTAKSNLLSVLIAHKANSSLCTMYKSQEQIRNKMHELKSLYREARDILQGKLSYAQIAADKQNNGNIPTQITETQKKQEIKGHQVWFGGTMANK